MGPPSALLTAFGLGFVYFISAIPVSVLAGAPLCLASIVAWVGYCSGGAIILLLGTPLRTWLTKKYKISFVPNEEKLFWRVWNRYGLIGLGLIAPVTIGPQASALILLALGVPPAKIFFWLSLGAIPFALGMALIVKLGTHFL